MTYTKIAKNSTTITVGIEKETLELGYTGHKSERKSTPQSPVLIKHLRNNISEFLHVGTVIAYKSLPLCFYFTLFCTSQNKCHINLK